MGTVLQYGAATVLWCVLSFIGFQLFFSGPTTPEQDAAISQAFGRWLGLGTPAIWGLVWVVGRGRS